MFSSSLCDVLETNSSCRNEVRSKKKKLHAPWRHHRQCSSSSSWHCLRAWAKLQICRAVGDPSCRGPSTQVEAKEPFRRWIWHVGGIDSSPPESADVDTVGFDDEFEDRFFLTTFFFFFPFGAIPFSTIMAASSKHLSLAKICGN